jgi:hypothetical protein
VSGSQGRGFVDEMEGAVSYMFILYCFYQVDYMGYVCWSDLSEFLTGPVNFSLGLTMSH